MSSEEESFDGQIATNRNNFIIGGFRKPQAVIERFHKGKIDYISRPAMQAFV